MYHLPESKHKEKKLISDIKRHVESCGFVLEFTDTGFAGAKGRIGSFDADEKKLIIAKTTRIPWVGTLIHEYSHFLQFQSKCKIWKEAAELGYYEYNAWLRHELEMSRQDIIICCKNIQALELDALIRSLVIIRKYNIITIHTKHLINRKLVVLHQVYYQVLQRKAISLVQQPVDDIQLQLFGSDYRAYKHNVITKEQIKYFETYWA